MRIRWKLLIALLMISLIPMLLLRLNGQSVMRRMGDELAEKARTTLFSKARSEMQTLVEEHSHILRRERQLIEMALSVQATKIEQSLAQSALSEINPMQGSAIPDVPEGKELTQGPADTKYFRLMGRDRIRPLSVSFDHISYRREGDRRRSLVISSPLVSIYRPLAEKHPDLFQWQITAYESGAQTIYPALAMIPGRYNALRSQWYRSAKDQQGFVWSLPQIDPLTGQMGFFVAQSIRYPDGSFAGASAIMVPVDAVLYEDEHFSKLSANAILLLVRIADRSGTEDRGVRILARKQDLETFHHHWQALAAEEWLETGDPSDIQKLVLAIRQSKTGVFIINYSDEKSLMGYGAIDEQGTALLVIVPQADLIAEAEAMEAYVQTRIERHILITGASVLSAIILVVIMALLFSKTTTRNIRRLLEAFRKVAAGDFKTRVRIRSGDEIGELGDTFDKMIPALEERVKIKQALDLTTQIQQNLLPRIMPSNAYLDITAQSVYCDETGGDFFDFPSLCCRAPDVVGVVIGDVSGHGIPAALLMATTRAALQSRVTQPGNIESIMADLNCLVTKDTSATHHFVTAFYAEFDPLNAVLNWVRAGHDPAIVYSPISDDFSDLKAKGPALGLDPDYEFQTTSTVFRPGQVFLAGTDGIWETRNPAGEMFGRDRVRSIVKAHARESAENILNAVFEALYKFMDGVKQEDDATLMIVKAQ